jgi:ribosomal protein S18 acetylase RimI-like enzyme
VPLTLLVVDRLYEAGAGFALSVGGEIEHSEHRMVLRHEPAAFRADPLVKVRPALREDARFIVACLAEAFDFPADHLDDDELDSLAERYSNTLVIERDGERVGTVRVEREDGGADVYGFAVLPLFQGRGIGRQVLSSIASELVAEGVPRVSLEVSTNNDGALGLYLSCGFEVTGTEDYWAVPIGAG